MIVGGRPGVMGISEASDLLGFSPQLLLQFTQNGVKNKKHPVSGSSADRNRLLVRKVRGEYQTGWSWQRGCGTSDSYSFQLSRQES